MFFSVVSVQHLRRMVVDSGPRSYRWVKWYQTCQNHGLHHIQTVEIYGSGPPVLAK